ncbi:hypothetical protein AQUCO_01100397v1 [Aquilegia coerulea]|uniref:Uncharacterized protein n=1 Tax=Aquilegia coerulea TaxID=218851 RepID=A0A2G5E6Z9_AQUCA|nr:hypothetical protein AQUCO_01100397v1 [Aquilegia coerulea]
MQYQIVRRSSEVHELLIYSHPSAPTMTKTAAILWTSSSWIQQHYMNITKLSKLCFLPPCHSFDSFGLKRLKFYLSSSTTSRYTSSSSLESNLSLQTLPSIPSLQKTTSDQNLSNISVSYVCVFSFKPQKATHITCLALSNNLLYAASGSDINVFDITNYALVDSFNDKHTNSGSVKSVTFSNGNVFTAHQDCKIRVWKITVSKRHQLIATLPTVKDRFRRFVSPKNHVSVRRHKKRLWIEHVDAISGLAVNNGLIYSVSWDKCLKIWRSKDMVCLESVKVHEDAVNAVAVSVDGTVYTGSADRKIRVWGKTFGKKHDLIATLEKHKSAVNALALSQDGSILFSGACDRSILVWEKEESANYMNVTGALRGHKGAILCLVNVTDILISGSADRMVRIWQKCGDSSRYNCLSVLEGHEKPVKSLVAVSEGVSVERIVSVCSGSLDGMIKVWRVEISNVKNSSPPLDY